MDNTVINNTVTTNTNGLANRPAVTSIIDLQNYAKGNIVELPPFGEGQPFVARVTRPSMLALAADNKIPNALLSAANDIFQNGAGAYDTENETALKDMFGVIRVFCEASLLEPTLQEVEAAGLTLTDEQMMFLFSYAQRGVQALEPFR